VAGFVLIDPTPKEATMLFAAIYRLRQPTEQSAKRSLALFTSWQPPFEFKAHWARADGDGGIAILEADDAAVVLEGIVPFTPYFEFEVSPVVEIMDAVPIFMKVNAWRDSVA
jgi:hypothetical protein